MSDPSLPVPNIETDDGDLVTVITFRPPGGGSGEVVMRELLLGMAPLVLIEMNLDGDDVVFNIDATGPEDGEQLARLLGGLVKALREGVPIDPPVAPVGEEGGIDG